MTNLIVDIGNTSVKLSVARGSTLDEIVRYSGDDIYQFISDNAIMCSPEVIAISSVRKFPRDFFSPLEKHCKRVIVIDSNTRFPIKNSYKSKNTLGADRILVAVAAAHLFPGKDIMIFDFGTALTIDFISSGGEFTGGNISLGLRSRFRALKDYTHLLPLLDNPREIAEIGTTTEEAIGAGVVLGLIFEVEGYIKKYPNHIYLFTGGDAIYFAEKLKNSIFVVYNLVLMGLARVAEDYAKPE